MASEAGGAGRVPNQLYKLGRYTVDWHVRRVRSKVEASEHAYLRDGAVGRQALQGPFIGVLAADLQNVCSALALGNFLDRQVPVRGIAIIDEVGRAKLMSAFELVVGR